MTFRPTLWPTLFTVPAVLILLGLGTWQLQRLEWKEALIAERVSRTTAPPVALTSETALPGDDLSELQYRRVVATGEFLHDKEMYLAARTFEGRPGHHVVTPFRLAEPALGARYILVDRGWVSLDRKAPESRPKGQVRGQVTVEGVVRLPAEPGWFTPENQPADNTWYWIDVPAMAMHAGLAGAVAPFYLEAAVAEIPGGYPIGGQTQVWIRNDHLQYAITWYSLAVALVVIYVVYHLRKPDREPR